MADGWEGAGPGDLDRRSFLGLAAAGAAAVPLGRALGARGRGAEPLRLPPGDTVVCTSALAAAPDRGPDAFAARLAAAREGGVHALFVPVAGLEAFDGTSRNLLRLHGLCDAHSDRASPASDPGAVAQAREAGRLAVVPVFQGARMIVERLELIARFRAAGVAVMALTHNWKNWNGDGCLERSDLRLTGLGVMAVRALNEAGVLIDLSRAGRRTSLHAMEATRAPVLFSHSGAAAVHAHPRNLTDEQLDACAATGGVVAVSGFPPFLSDGSGSLEDLLRHVGHVVERIGVDHAAVALDFPDRLPTRAGAPLPDPPYRLIDGFDGLERVGRLREALEAAGHGSEAVSKLLGGNVLRVWRAALEEAGRAGR